MAVERKLELDIDVNKSSFTKKMEQANQSSKKFGDNFDKAIKKVNDTLKNSERTIDDYSNAIGDVQKVVERLSKTSLIKNKPAEALNAARSTRKVIENEMKKMGAFDIDINADIDLEKLNSLNKLYDQLTSVERKATSEQNKAVNEQNKIIREAQKERDAINKARLQQERNDAKAAERIYNDRQKAIALAAKAEAKAVEQASRQAEKAEKQRLNELQKNSKSIRDSFRGSTFNQKVTVSVDNNSYNNMVRTLASLSRELSSSLASGARVGGELAYRSVSKFVGSSVSAFSQITRASANVWSGAANAISSTNSIAQKTGSNILSAFKQTNNAGSNLTRTVLGLTAGFVSLRSATNLFKSSIGRMDEIDRATKSLTVLTGSYDEAQSIVSDTIKVLEGTPVALDDTIGGVKRLIATGMQAEKVNKTIQAINDAAFGVGRGEESASFMLNAFAQMQSSSQLYLEDLNQLQDQGVPALRILANQMGKTTDETKKMISKGLVPSSQAIDVLVDGIENGTNGVNGMTTALGGLAKTAGDTMSGAFSNFNIQMKSLGADILTPFKDNIINTFSETIKIMKLFRTNVLQSEAVQERLNKVSTRVYSVILKFLNRIESGIESNEKFTLSLDNMSKAFAGLGSAAAVVTLAPIFGQIASSAFSGAEGLNSVMKVAESTTRPFSKLTSVSKSLSNNLNQASSISKRFKIADLGEVLSSTTKNNELNIAKLAEEASKVETDKQNALDIVQRGIAKNRASGMDISSEDELAEMEKVSGGYDTVLSKLRRSTDRQESYMKNKDLFGGILSKMTKGLNGTVGLAGEGIAKLLGGSLNVATNMISMFGDAAIKVLSSTTRMIISAASASLTAGFVAILGGGLLAGLGYVDNLFGDRIRKLVDKVATEGPDIIKNLTASISKQLPDLMKSGTDLLMYIMQGVNSVLPTLLQSLGDIGIQLAEGFVKASPVIIKSALSVVNQLAGFVATYGPKLISQGADLLINLGKGIAEALPSFLKNVGSFLTDTLNVINSKVPDFFNMGVTLLQGLSKGLVDNVPKVIGALTRTIGSIASNFASNKDAIVKSINDVVSMIRRTIADNGPSLLDAVGSILFTIADGIIALAPNVIGGFADIIVMVADWIGNNSDMIVDTFLNMVITAAQIIADNGPRMITSVYGMLDKMVDAIQDNKDKFVLAGITLAGALLSSFGAALQGLGKVIENILTPVFEWIGKMIDAIVESFRNMWKNSPMTSWLGSGMFNAFGGGGTNLFSANTASDASAASLMSSNSLADSKSLMSAMSMRSTPAAATSRNVNTQSINRNVMGINSLANRGNRILVHTELVGDKIYTYISDRTANENDDNMML